jgi:hypothetical protein
VCVCVCDIISNGTHEYGTKYKRNIEKNIPKFNKQFGTNISIPITFNLFIILKINI